LSVTPTTHLISYFLERFLTHQEPNTASTLSAFLVTTHVVSLKLFRLKA